MKNKIIFILSEVSRIALSFVLLFSSIVKANDPVGLSLKIREYLSFLPYTINGIVSYLSIPISLFIIGIEFIIALRLILGINPKRTTIISFLFMLFMTIITIVINITSSVTDCGCFGDAIHLTNLETLVKNIVLLGVSIFLMRHSSLIKPVWTKEMMNVNKYLAIAGFTIFMITNYYCLPYIDFRPYSEGTNIRDSIYKQDIEYNDFLVNNTKYIYIKDNIEKSFDINDLPNDQSGWKFLRVEDAVYDKGLLKYDFHPIEINKGTDVSKNILESKKPFILVVSKGLNDIDSSDDQFIYTLANNMKKKGYAQYFLFVEGQSGDAGNFSNLYANDLGCVATIDNTTAYTITRNFPTILVVRDGVIIKKISWLDFPKLSNITTFVSALPNMKTTKKGYMRIIILSFAIIVCIVGNIKHIFTNNINQQNIKQ